MTPEELQAIRDNERKQRAGIKHTFRVCSAASCLSCGAEQVTDALNSVVGHYGLDEEAVVKPVGCMGLCSAGPLVSIDSDKVMYKGVQAEDAREIVENLGGPPIERLHCPTDTPFFTMQKKVVLENSGQIDPERIEDYIAARGYGALTRALVEMDPEDIIAEVTTSGLSGRGGAGYPTGLKWSTVAKSTTQSIKYVVCNADEGDPGAFMDRSILEGDPHRVIEGMTLAAYAVGASHGYIYVRAEYPLAIKRLKLAIRQATKLGLLGYHIGGTRFTFNIEIRLGAGAFVCGEETALLASIEGRRGQPRPRPPYPAASGLWDCPTLINNVETFANIPTIVRNGGAWFANIGTEDAKGTKVFALAGKIQNTGLIEVPMGITLRQIIYDIGGGIPDGRRFKAVQTGGPSGGCIPEQHLDMPVEPASLREVGSIMGSGGMIVMDDTSSMVDVARYFMEFCMTESCGKCIPCRDGTYFIHELLKRIADGEGRQDDLETLIRLCKVVQVSSLCGLGQTAPNPVLSTLRYFEHEYRYLLTDDEAKAPAAHA